MLGTGMHSEKGVRMFGKRIAAALFAAVLAMGLVPCLAFAAQGGALQAAPAQLEAQAVKDLRECTIKFTDDAHVCGDTDTYQMYFVKGKNEAAAPSFDLYYKGQKVDPRNYTVKYRLSWWDEKAGRDRSKAVSASDLVPSSSPEADIHNMSSEYRLTIEAKGNVYTGSYADAAVVVADWYCLGYRTANYLSKAKEGWHYAINPMNDSYYVIPQSKVKATLNSLVIMAGSSPGEGHMNRDGTKVASKYYTVSYYKTKKAAVDKNMSPASSAKVGKKLAGMPTQAGSYVMIIKGKKPYYGTASILFDIQGSMSDVKVAKVAAQTENGKYLEPSLKVTYKGATLKKGVDYDVTFKNNLKAGTATATITGTRVRTNTDGIVDDVNKARFFTGSKTVKFTINKHATKTWKANPMSASAKTLNVNADALRDKGDQTFGSSKAFKVSGAKGSVTYQMLSGPSVIKVAKNGEVTVARHVGLVGKGKTFSAKVRVRAAGTSTYYAKQRVLTLKVAVK